MTGLLPYAAALDRLLAGVQVLPAQMVPLAQCAGRVAAAPVMAQLTQPPFAAAAMDGYAIRWDDVQRQPWAVVGTSAAGGGWPGTLNAGQTVRIYTGAPLPAGADTIAVQEDVTRSGEQAHLSGTGPAHRGAHIRAIGQDFSSGDLLIAAGTRLTGPHLGLAAAAGHSALAVVRRPRITLIATGDELVPPGAVPGPGQIISSVPVMLAALLRGAGAQVVDPGIVRDDRAALAAAIAAADADIIITIGGASVGAHDLVVPVLHELGAALDFWKVAIRPGKPFLSGTLSCASPGQTPRRVLGLPGNPVSAFVTALLFAVPLAVRLGGRSDVLLIQHLPLAAPLAANDGRRDHLRARRSAAGVTACAAQDSGLLSVLAAADVLIIREPHAPAAAAGDLAACIALDMFRSVY